MTVLFPTEAASRLRKEYAEGRLIPFIGAGFSKPLNLPSWNELVSWMAVRAGFEPELFELHGTYQQLAEFFDATRYGNLNALIHEMTIRFDAEEFQIRRRSSITHQALARLNW